MTTRAFRFRIRESMGRIKRDSRGKFCMTPIQTYDVGINGVAGIDGVAGIEGHAGVLLESSSDGELDRILDDYRKYIIFNGEEGRSRRRTKTAIIKFIATDRLQTRKEVVAEIRKGLPTDNYSKADNGTEMFWKGRNSFRDEVTKLLDNLAANSKIVGE